MVRRMRCTPTRTTARTASRPSCRCRPGSCSANHPAIPAGARRWVISPESLAAWKFSPFWQTIRATQAIVDAIPQDRDLIVAPILAASDADPTTVWLVDKTFRRAVPSPEVAAAWGFDLAAVEIWPAADLAALVEGTPVRPQPVLLQGTGPELYVLDDHQCDPAAAPTDPLCAGTDTQTSGLDDTGTSEPGHEGGQISASGDSSDASDDTSGSSSEGPALPPGFGQDGDGACGCTQPAPSAPALMLLGALGLVGRPRRRRLPRPSP